MKSAEELLSLIQSRRTCYQFEDKKLSPVKDQDLWQCLQAAIWAPNHKLTEPWRFWVLSDQQQSQLAQIYAELRANQRAEPETENYQMIYRQAIEKFCTFPKIILVGQLLADNKVTRKEDYAACACAIQNFQLMAWQQQIGVQWSTGPILKDKRTYQQIEANPAQIELVGALYMGNLKGDCSTQNGKRKPLEEVVFGMNKPQ